MKEFARFAWIGFLFLLPVLLVIGIPELLLWKSGETMTIKGVIRYMEKDSRPVLFRRAFIGDNTQLLKFEMIKRNQPRIVALGSSRVMQFRGEMFDQPGEGFYNAGGLVGSLSDLEEFTEVATPEILPQILILGVDFWWLIDDVPDNNALERFIDQEDAQGWGAHRLAMLSLIPHLKDNPHVTWELLGARGASQPISHIGFAAITKNSGFRKDGSFYAGQLLVNWPRPLSESHTSERPDVHLLPVE